MKKQLLTAIGLLLTGSSWAQTEKGNGIISGTVSVEYSKTDNNYRSINPSLNLTAGRFFADSWLMGLSTRLTGTFIKQDLLNYPTVSTQDRIVYGTVTPFVRRYWRFNPVHFFAGAGLSVTVSGSRHSGLNFDNAQPILINNHNVSVSVDPYFEGGMNYLLTSRLGLQLLATANSIPFNVAGVSAGLVYWTGPSRRVANKESTRINPQTDKGRWLLEGSFSVYNQNDQQYQTSSRTPMRTTSARYSLNPSVGMFIEKNSLIGISLPISVSNAKNETGDQSATLWSVGISPYYQRYWSSTRITPYTRVNASYSTYFQTHSSLSGGTARMNSFGAGLNVGLAYMAGQRFIVETSLGSLSLNYQTNDNPYKNWKANITAGLTGNFAVRYAFK